MLRAFLSGISGLRNHQLRMDVIGNNIANMNTVGFKSSRVTFEEGFAEVLAGASGPSDTRGSINAEQVGSGARVAGIDTLFSQGALEATGQPLDMAIQGRTLFVLSDGEKNLYSRAGNFRMDPSGRLVLAGTGLALQGINADSSGQLTGPSGDIILHPDETAPARKTTRIELKGNLDAAAEVDTKHVMAGTVYDELGNPIELTLIFTAQGDGKWTWEARTTDGELAPPSGGTVTFGADGSLQTLDYGDGPSGLKLTQADGTSLNIDLITAAGALVSRAGDSTAAVSSQDGRRAGELVSVSVEQDGTIQGVFSNGEVRNLARIAQASFANISGLERAGETASSGEAQIGFAGEAGSSVLSGALENSNVDISKEFTDMIIAQRGFQANARVITT